MEKYPILFVGAGPGDPELITVKGQKALAKADLVIYAGSLVPEALLQWTPDGCDRRNSASMNLETIVTAMAGAYDAGKRVVRLHTGDPSLYGAIAEQIAALRACDIPFRIIPGVTAAFAAAAAMGVEYTLPEITQTLILTRLAGRTPVPESESLERLAGHRASLAIYLSISMVDKVAEILSRNYGPDAPVAVAFCVSHPEERIFRATASGLPELVERENIRKTALIIAGPAVDAGILEGMTASKLYDKAFSHAFRDSDDG